MCRKLTHFFSLLVLALSALSAQAQSITNAPAATPILLDEPYTFTFTTSGFTQTPTFLVTSTSPNVLPPGLNLSSAGVITGTPSSADGGTTYTFTVTASDNGVDNPATQSCTISVALATIPQGVMMYTFTTATSTYVSFPLTAQPVYSDQVSSVSSNTITVANASAFTGALTSLVEAPTGTSTIPYYVVFTSGAQAGRVLAVTANTATSLTLDTTDNGAGTAEFLSGNPDKITSSAPTTFNVAAGASGDTFEVLPGDTLSTVFGSNASGSATPLILTGNTAANLRFADLVSFRKTPSVAAVSYFYNTADNYWERSGDKNSPHTNFNNLPIPPFSPFQVTVRNGNPTAMLSVSGRVADVALLTRTTAQSTTFNTTGYATDLTLGTLDLGPNFATNNTARFADSLGVYDVSKNPPRFDAYYENASSTWLLNEANSPTFNNIPITAGSVIEIKKLSGSGAASFLQSALPYNLNQ